MQTARRLRIPLQRRQERAAGPDAVPRPGLDTVPAAATAPAADTSTAGDLGRVPDGPAAAPSRPAAASELLPGNPTAGGVRRVFAGRRRAVTVGLAVLLVVGVCGALLLARGGAAPTAAPAPPVAGHTQRTVLFAVADPGSAATATALLAADPAAGSGSVLLLPNTVLATAPGRGPLPLAEVFTQPDAALPSATVGDLLGVTVGGTWRLSRAGLAALVDSVGGVQVTVDQQILGPATADGTRPVLLPAGPRRLTGTEAVSYLSATPPGDAEPARLPRLQAVLDGIVAGLPRGEGAVTARLGALGAGSVADVPWLGSFLTDLVSADGRREQVLPTVVVDTGGPQRLYRVDPAALTPLVDATLADSRPAGLRDGGARVLILNGVGTPGLGEDARARLLAAGLVFAGSSNAATFDHMTSQVLIPDATDASRAAGRKVAAALGLPESDVLLATSTQNVADVLVVLGADYRPS